MDCPLCKINLHMADRQGIEIDYCPKCRGIWVDRGELEKLVELPVGSSAASFPPFPGGVPDRATQDAARRRESDAANQKPGKKESWLSNLLDFD